jgi:glycerol uptake operon antiterminator
LFAIERTFLLDSAALQSSMRSMEQFLPDALEVLPAVVAPKMVARLLDFYPDLPVIAGGLVQTLRELEDLVHQGASAVSVSESSLWVA